MTYNLGKTPTKGFSLQPTTSVTELVTASQCEFSAARNFELKQGWRLAACGFPAGQSCGQETCTVHGADDMLTRLAQLGDMHEQDFLAQLHQQFGEQGVIDASAFSPQDLLTAVAELVPVLFQAPVRSRTLVGRADFLVLQNDGTYAVYDTKLARSAQSSAVLQIAAYAQAFKAMGLPISRTGYLVLGSGQHTAHKILDVIPVFELLAQSYQSLIASLGPDSLTMWGPTEQGGTGLNSCGRCDNCEEQLVPARDVLLVMGCTTGHRSKLNSAGIFTVDDLAALTYEEGHEFRGDFENTTGIRDAILFALSAQAQLYLAGQEDSPEGPGQFRVIDSAPFGLLREPDAGDIFFDFEGDPLHTEPGSPHWGLEYLFGWCTRDLDDEDRPAFHALWAHDRAAEKIAFETFIDYLLERFSGSPGMHVYHYAPYETTALKRLATLYGTKEEELDHLLRSGLFVDLYAVVRGGLRTSGRSLSIKKLEPFYIAALGQSREGVTNAADSITAYSDAVTEKELGNDAEFERRLALLTDYNRYDCESTLHLYNWLTSIAEDNGVVITANPVAPQEELLPQSAEPDPVYTALRDFIDRAIHAGELEEDEAVVARMAWAAMDYHKREAKQFWWEHFSRLQDPVEDWTGSEIFRPQRAEVISDWQMVGRERTPSRILALYGELELGNKLRPGAKVMSVYDAPAPDGLQESSTATRKYNSSAVTIEEIEPVSGTDRVRLSVKEKLPKDLAEFSDLPIGLTPPSPISTAAVAARLHEFGAEIAGLVKGKESCEQVRLPVTARTNLLVRRGAVTQHASDHDWVANVIAALESQPHAVVAVQGPPGAGKTYVASHVIGQLVRQGWKIAVVAQSHAVVDNVLAAVVKNGQLPASMVGKRPGGGAQVPEGTTDMSAAKAQKFYAEATGGFVVGGTAWALCAENFLPEGGFDLVVIDEAGQYSLANALAVSHGTDKLLLLGDPQQLPQVSQGTHPEPVNESVLGWMVGTDATISPDRGFFLDQTWRMHPDLTAPVSELSYEGKLHSVAKTVQRSVAGVIPGLHARQLDHQGNVAVSVQEADEVVAIITQLLGSLWQLDSATPERPLVPSDFIVVAPYNAQVHLLQERLEAAGFEETRVGTVDKFQGQEAPIAIVSLATSSAQEAPRGLEFVRNRNRLNVSISRGQHSSYLVYSKHLLTTVPSQPDQIEEQGAFLRLCAEG